jgi:hypothetical protein
VTWRARGWALGQHATVEDVWNGIFSDVKERVVNNCSMLPAIREIQVGILQGDPDSVFKAHAARVVDRIYFPFTARRGLWLEVTFTCGKREF